MTALIAVHTHYYPPLDISPGAPALVVQITELVHSYMIWAGSCEEIPGAEASTEPSEAITQPTSSLADASENAKVAISRQDVALVDGVDPRVLSAIQRGRIAKDWACAMPSGNVRSQATWLHRDRMLIMTSSQPAIPTPSTSLFRSNESDVALSMSQQLGETI